MPQLPHVSSLQEAVKTVIKENKRDRYNPTYFTRTIANATDLVTTCSTLIKSQSSYSALSDALLSHPDLLTLEDFVAVYGEEWGFSPEVIAESLNRVQVFNVLVGHQRYQ
ncbi:hypothetical protein JZ785_27050 [Alicyclobacillus curvatus]|nr:hypothetical protein JZ785_27050 [Alicyclobacillus curvatus]